MTDKLASIGRWFAAHYDKIVAAIAIIVLVGSGVLFWQNGSKMERDERDLTRWLNDITPTHPDAPVVDTSEFEEAARLHENQYQIEPGSLSSFRPEKRYTCHDCRRPRPFPGEGVPLEKSPCPFCKAIIIIPPEPPDDDKDGMLDKWEQANGLDDSDPSDAGHDPDKDGFTSLEEHDANPKTSPQKAEEHPPIIDKLSLHTLNRIPLNLLFQGSTQLEGEKPRVSINRGRQTYFKYIGEKLFGFTLKKLEKKSEERPISEGATTRIEVDVSELTLEKDGEEFILIKGKPETQFIYHAQMKFEIDGSLYERLFKNSDFELGAKSRYKGRKIKVKTIDRQKKRVLIQDTKTGKERWFEER